MVILIYCFLMSLSEIAVKNGLFLVLLFSVFIEFLQLVNIESIVHYELPKVVMLILGNSFSVLDLLAYCFGIICTAEIEYYFNSAEIKTGK